MKTDELDYHLPPELIAQTPADRRTASRLLVLHCATGRLEDRLFADLPEYLRAEDCLVLNNTKVLPARFYFQRSTGSRFEALFLNEPISGQWQAMVKNARRLKAGEMLTLLDRNSSPTIQCKAVSRTDDGCWLLVLQEKASPEVILSRVGFAPLPPYIKRDGQTDPAADDLARYQTVFAERPGAVAAPTAGLHFDQAMLDRVGQLGVMTTRVTLHVGAGTFKPVQTELLEDHPIHSERYEMPADSAARINAIRKAGGRIVAVGTTSVRTLEASAREGIAAASAGDTRLFITPGYRFQLVDAMITNFHLPRSTLLALVAAFAGLSNILNAYHHAIEARYRFYSYGDAMLLM